MGGLTGLEIKEVQKRCPSSSQQPTQRSFFEKKLKADENIIKAGLANDKHFISSCVSDLTEGYHKPRKCRETQEEKKYTNVDEFWKKSSQWLGKEIKKHRQKQEDIRRPETQAEETEEPRSPRPEVSSGGPPGFNGGRLRRGQATPWDDKRRRLTAADNRFISAANLVGKGSQRVP